MVDINKYLESQLALAKLRSECKSKKDGVSLKSRTAADHISKRQVKKFAKVSQKEKVDQKSKLPQLELNKSDLKTEPAVSASIAENSDDDEDYVPSEDEDETIHLCPLKVSSRAKESVQKIIDDGDTSFYNERIKTWRHNLAMACAGDNKVEPLSADIRYILNGNEDPEENHELQNGYLVPNYIWKQLYKFQRTGVKWLWELHQVQSGGLLGDEMGLGKTIQIIAFLTGLSKTNSGSWDGLGPSIIVAPATVIYQWVSHFHYWCPHLRVAVLHHTGSHSGNHNKLVRDIYASHGILLLTYAGIVKYHKEIMARKWHYLILDEGHKIRNPDTQVSKLIKKIQTPHKLIITGSPLQNSLQELWSLFDFMKPGLLGTYNTFMIHFAQPITQGGYANATEMQEATALEIAKALKNIITPYMLRRSKTEVQDHIKLPEKNEQVLFCALTVEQKDLYLGYLMGSTVRSILDKENKYGDPLRARVLVALTTLRKICNHPDLYLYEAQEDCEQVDADKFGHWKRSGKMSVVNSLLKIWQKQGHRALIFTQSRAMLCILEQYLQNQKYKYLKMDGSVSVGQRQNLIRTFNEKPEYLVFLATTRVGGLGVNLTGADRVIIYDPDWNPATDDQAKERAWRIGQARNVTVYRLLSAGTIEEKIYQRQIFKHFLSNKILLDPNQKNVLSTSTLQGLFSLEEPNFEGDTETASLFKHTKINVSNSKNTKDKTHSRNDLHLKKLEAMKKMAKAISKKISQDSVEYKNNVEVKDPRIEYKRKQDILRDPPVIETPEINLVDDKETNVPFEHVLSELDIINMHIKKDYEETLIKNVLKNTNPEEKEIDDDIEPSDTSHININESSKVVTSSYNDNSKQVCNKNINNIKKGHKRKHTSLMDEKVENLVTVKKVKKKVHKSEIQSGSDDDYVLSKLFAKAAVKNALQHDVVVGLAEKEKRHRMKEEAEKKAKDAVRALKFSST
ncbi:DNA excision repair protein ERCC-6-like [Manduca sexta]|uniref:DNA repair and recombination protein RAD54-like n=1 Tax=Manduca sexta TaxID=7130 RepID=A0A921ZC16_MANSE|nr:DNA excision repair protein ERCC-6-like [Manduca sexta]KAG6454750.1 hypothetical protein O3G_MSEX008876 [Manduca sexta]